MFCETFPVFQFPTDWDAYFDVACSKASRSKSQFQFPTDWDAYFDLIAGPAEATLIGNLLIQAQACGALAGQSIRDVVRASENLTTFNPQGDSAAERQRFQQLSRAHNQGEVTP